MAFGVKGGGRAGGGNTKAGFWQSFPANDCQCTTLETWLDTLNKFLSAEEPKISMTSTYASAGAVSHSMQAAII